jgi:hypothetical protein
MQAEIDKHQEKYKWESKDLVEIKARFRFSSVVPNIAQYSDKQSAAYLELKQSFLAEIRGKKSELSCRFIIPRSYLILIC